MFIRKFVLPILAITASYLPLHAGALDRRASISGKGGDQGKCTIEVDVDGSAQVEISGDRGRLRTLSGQPSEWRRFECTGPLPQNPMDFRFRGIDGRGEVHLMQEPRYNHGVAVVRIDDPRGGREGYTFDLEWRGKSGEVNEFYPEGNHEGEQNDNYSSSLRIMRATYGSENRYRDVTPSLQRMVQNGRLELRVDNDTLGTDPAPNREKELHLTYEFRGRQREIVVREGEWLRLPERGSGREQWTDHSDLRIVNAVYGAPGQFRDVADSLQSMVWNDRLDFQVNNEAFRMDPAPGRKKELKVTYDYNGRRQNVNVREGSRCSLP